MRRRGSRGGPASPSSSPAVALVTGIYPPDLGGPATHSADLRECLSSRGYSVSVVTLTDNDASSCEEGVVRFPRRWPWPIRLVRVTSWLVKRRTSFDLIYATGMDVPAVAAGRLSGRPVVVKVVGDPVWERGRRRGWTVLDFEAFQTESHAHPGLRAMAWLRDWALSHANRVVVPSHYLKDLVTRWIGSATPVEVVPNGVRGVPPPPRDAVMPSTSLRLVAIGRLIPHKRFDRIIEAVARSASAELVLIGEGPDQTRLHHLVDRFRVGPRVKFAGNVPHDDVYGHLFAADALVVASDYEGLPHVVLEALATGTPVITPSVGGTAEVLRDRSNAILLPEASVEALSAAFDMLASDPELLDRLRVGAISDSRLWTFERCADRLETIFHSLTGVMA